MITARNFFTASDEDKRKFRLATEKQKCSYCGGDGSCNSCEGSGKMDHECDCMYCTFRDMEECDDCGGNGECPYCHGEGARLLGESDLRQAGFSKGEARRIVNSRPR